MPLVFRTVGTPAHASFECPSRRVWTITETVSVKADKARDPDVRSTRTNGLHPHRFAEQRTYENLTFTLSKVSSLLQKGGKSTRAEIARAQTRSGLVESRSDVRPAHSGRGEA